MSIVGLVDPTDHLFWLGSRALGIVALLLVSISVGFGLALSARLGQRPGSASRFRVLHEAVAVVSLLAIVGHGLLLLGDHFLHPTFAQVTIPFLLDDNRLWTGIGVVAGWLAIAFALSFYVRKQIGIKLWRRLHRWTALVFVLALAHTLGSGTDARSSWAIVMLALVAAPVALLGGLRLTKRRGAVSSVPAASLLVGSRLRSAPARPAPGPRAR